MVQFSNAGVTPDAFEFCGVPALLGRAIASEDGLAYGSTFVLVDSFRILHVY